MLKSTSTWVTHKQGEKTYDKIISAYPLSECEIAGPFYVSFFILPYF